ncbi:MAG: hypothetical protein K2Y12_11150 [Chitinophagaceae bacterium]|jgi:cytochrome c biogenesis protein CcdA|nr:hypothetical protein [Chitinophagaceae bacterium]
MTAALILSALGIGFAHSFETDHLLAVSNIVSSRNKLIKAIKDGLFWGLGHTSTILIVSIFFLTLKYQVNEKIFSYFEAIVGVMLVLLGTYRLIQLAKSYRMPIAEILPHTHAHHADTHSHTHIVARPELEMKGFAHLSSYFIGTVHGLAGSGSVIIGVLATMESIFSGYMYLLVFGIGSIGGMILAATTFGLPFTQKLISNKIFQAILIVASSLLSIYFGIKIIFEHI